MLWVGSFVSGLLMGSHVSLTAVVSGTLLTFFSGFYLIYIRASRLVTLGLVGLSLIAIMYIVSSGYQYGEHKVVHLLGPAWTYSVVVAIVRLLGTTDTNSNRLFSLSRTFFGVGMFSCLLIILVFFLNNGRSQLDSSRGPHGINFGVNTLVSHISPGNSVLLDDSAWIGVEKFHKGHYLTFLIHDIGAHVLMPEISGDPLRGGYWRNSLNNTLMNAKDVDWLVQSRSFSSGRSKIVPIGNKLVWETADFGLYHVDKKPIVVAGNGWYDCEPDHCWTKNKFEIEVFHSGRGQYQLLVDFWTFSPPENGIITVRTSGGQLLARTDANSKMLYFDIPEGWSKVVVSGDWPVASPKLLGMSDDDRQ